MGIPGDLHSELRRIPKLLHLSQEILIVNLESLPRWTRSGTLAYPNPSTGSPGSRMGVQRRGPPGPMPPFRLARISSSPPSRYPKCSPEDTAHSENLDCLLPQSVSAKLARTYLKIFDMILLFVPATEIGRLSLGANHFAPTTCTEGALAKNERRA